MSITTSISNFSSQHLLSLGEPAQKATRRIATLAAHLQPIQENKAYNDLGTIY